MEIWRYVGRIFAYIFSLLINSLGISVNDIGFYKIEQTRNNIYNSLLHILVKNTYANCLK